MKYNYKNEDTPFVLKVGLYIMILVITVASYSLLSNRTLNRDDSGLHNKPAAGLHEPAKK